MATQSNRRVYQLQAEICRGLAHPVRLEVVHLLGDRELAFGDLAAEMQIPKPKLSQHLAILKRTGIVVGRRDQARVFYRLQYPEVEAACQAVGQILAKHLVEMQADTNVLIQTVRRRRRPRLRAAV